MPAEICVFETKEELICNLSLGFLRMAAEIQNTRHFFTVAFGGGRTPVAMNRKLATLSSNKLIDWSRTLIFFNDERCVPVEHQDSNYGMFMRTLFQPLSIPLQNVHRICGECEPETAASAYSRKLEECFCGSDIPAFDLILLGLGSDGHTASLFPKSPALFEDERWVVHAGKGPEGWERITLTYPVINAAREVWFIISGHAKSEVVSRLINGPFEPQVLPAQGVRPLHGRLKYLMDKDAAKELRLA